MLPGASSGDLLYASSSIGDTVYVFSYPAGKLVGKIVPPGGALALGGICSGKNGKVYVTVLSKKNEGYIYRYVHGSAKPEAHYSLSRVLPFGCSVDPTTNTLAVATVSLGASAGYLSTFPLSGSGKVYYSYYISNYYYCAYDGSGNLFVNGQGAGSEMYLAEARKGGSELTVLALNKAVSVSGMGQLQFDGHDMTFEDLTASAIYRLHVSGAKASFIGTTRLGGWNYTAISWIQGGTVLIPTGADGTSIGAWKYPAGGMPTKKIKAPAGIFSETISVAGSK